MPACWTEGDGLTVPTFALVPRDVAGFIGALWEFQAHRPTLCGGGGGLPANVELVSARGLRRHPGTDNVGVCPPTRYTMRGDPGARHPATAWASAGARLHHGRGRPWAHGVRGQSPIGVCGEDRTPTAQAPSRDERPAQPKSPRLVPTGPWATIAPHVAAIR